MIPLAKPDVGFQEIEEVTKVLKSGILSLGPKIRNFEQSFASHIGTKYAVGVNSGTSGLHLAVRSLNLKEGDEVITTPFSFIASSNCLLYEDVTPVFVDVEEESFNIDPSKIEAAITKNTKALLIAHIFGQSCNMTQIMKIAKKYNLKIIEDACESIDAVHYNQKTGTFGDVAVFAFYPNKQMTTGEGGMIVTNNSQIYEYCKSACNQGRSNDKQWLLHDKLGFNYRMDEMSAAVGLVQLKKIENLIGRREIIASLYNKELSDIANIKTPFISNGNNSTWFVYPIRVNAQKRDQIIQNLLAKEIQCKAYFDPSIHHQPFYIEKFRYSKGHFPVAERLSKETLVIPLYPSLKKKDVDYIIESLKEELKK